MRQSRFIPLLIPIWLLAADRNLAGAGKAPPLISGVKTSPSAFLPALGQHVDLTAKLLAGGQLRVEVLDRDGYVVRTIASGKAVKRGSLKLSWNGRDDSGKVVPDEAYSFRLELKSPKGRGVYFPANEVPEMYEVPPAYYSRSDGNLVYELPRASRVHLQAGESALDPVEKEMLGPVLKTIVNREPRPVGRVVEHWNGRDETGTLQVAELPHFVVGIACWALPENSVIATGNRGGTFVDYVASRKGTTRITAVPSHRHHHAGLTTLEDLSPVATVVVKNGARTGVEGCWETSGTSVTLAVDVTGPSADRFREQPGHIDVYDGIKRIAKSVAKARGNEVVVTLAGPLDARKTLAVNWVSDFGPTAPGALCVTPPEASEARRRGENR